GSLPDRVGRVAREARRRAEENGQTIVVGKGGGPVTADPDLLRRVLENLVDNALKYAGRGGTIGIESAPRPDGSAEIRVMDDGPGIPAELREKIFEKYVRLDRDANV